jgi:hypothetical protein
LVLYHAPSGPLRNRSLVGFDFATGQRLRAGGLHALVTDVDGHPVSRGKDRDVGYVRQETRDPSGAALMLPLGTLWRLRADPGVIERVESREGGGFVVQTRVDATRPGGESYVSTMTFDADLRLLSSAGPGRTVEYEYAETDPSWLMVPMKRSVHPQTMVWYRWEGEPDDAVPWDTAYVEAMVDAEELVDELGFWYTDAAEPAGPVRSVTADAARARQRWRVGLLAGGAALVLAGVVIAWRRRG